MNKIITSLTVRVVIKRTALLELEGIISLTKGISFGASQAVSL